MIKYKKLPANIQELLPKAARYLQERDDVAFAYFFGSFGKGKPLPLSDVDIAVYLKEKAAPLTLRMRILETGRVIADNTPFVRHQYESLTMREFFDFSRVEKGILERRFSLG